MARPSGIRSCRKRKCPRTAVDVISAAVAATFTVPLSELRHRSRRRAAVALARQSAMYLAHVTFGLSFAEVGRVYAPFLLANADALARGAEQVECQIDGRPWVQKPFPYQGKCLQWLREGYAALASVVTKQQQDSMESFVFAETFKYFFLLFSPSRTLDFEHVVLNTEAHPLRRF